MTDPLDEIDKVFKNILPGREDKWVIPWYATINEDNIPSVMVKLDDGEIWLRPDIWKDFISNIWIKEEER